MSVSTNIPTHLTPSELGTKEYWDDLYTLEISNHESDPLDVGTIWFDDCSAEDKAVEFLHSAKLGLNHEHTSFLDLGTGNGHFLFRLRNGEEESDDDEEDEEKMSPAGFRGRMMGVDYSEKSVEFARTIAEAEQLGRGQEGHIEFEQYDLLNDPITKVLSIPNEGGWDVVLDKGTFDAISLAEQKDAQNRRLCEGYKERVVPLVKKGGLFFITSCNWTADELKGWFDGGEFRYEDEVTYKTFSFGGQKGSSIASLCFRRLAG